MKILILANYDVGLYQFRRELIQALLREHQVTMYMTEALQTNEAAVALFRSRNFKVIGELSTPVTDDTGTHEISQYTLQLEL